jgi:hypothetical protein
LAFDHILSSTHRYTSGIPKNAAFSNRRRCPKNLTANRKYMRLVGDYKHPSAQCCGTLARFFQKETILTY